ncbi:MAG: RNA 2',3'-cyclic phosphodiesterase [Pirellulales bacterium]|nr:RNA 2',3'-cyclic phosphodiesterase [Pirellulales bacterium]
MPKPLRTFVAVETSPGVRNRACDVIGKLSRSAASVRWVEPEQMHWTLAFLGDVRMDDVVNVCRAVQRGAEQVAEFSLHAQGTGAFPTSDRPRTVWLGTKQGTDEMVSLHDAIEAQLDKLGFRGERRKYTPHLTLGRVRRSAPHEVAELGELVEKYAHFDAGKMPIDEAVVFSSRLGPDGPSYDELGRAALASS